LYIQVHKPTVDRISPITDKRIQTFVHSGTQAYSRYQRLDMLSSKIIRRYHHSKDIPQSGTRIFIVKITIQVVNICIPANKSEPMALLGLTEHQERSCDNLTANLICSDKLLQMFLKKHGRDMGSSPSMNSSVPLHHSCQLLFPDRQRPHLLNSIQWN
jgi:hypothetical protein